MSSETLPLILGTVLALGALSFVLLPLLSTAESGQSPTNVRAGRSALETTPDNAQDGLAVSALREIEFDRATGKLSDSDYDELKAKYTTLALAELRQQDDAALARQPLVAADPNEDPVEAAVRAVQARRPKCGSCGPRPESDATYCSSCGGYLPGACGACGAEVGMPGARFCNSCGGQLAAA